MKVKDFHSWGRLLINYFWRWVQDESKDKDIPG